MTTKVLIADDEAPARSRMRRLLDELTGYEVIGEAANGNEALQISLAESPDIILLDIRMPDMDGIETARHLSTLDDSPAVIFTTAFDSYAIEAFDTHAIGYLLKPVRREKLERALGFAAQLARPQIEALGNNPQQPSTRNNICARHGTNLHLIPIEDVMYFQADQKYITVRHVHGEDLIDEPLKELAREFTNHFIRIHRNALVALTWVERMEKTPEGQYEVWLRDCAEPLPVSRRHVTAVKACVKKRA
ncbi:MAG: LytTR family DNA-binding domain-containing protein [Gammaproteobacteria bacterium]|jgi:two-component system response regulator AlgR|nr:DNA-binding response regulator [Chromatiales bacterium]MDP6673328.1 LytTR family DNA-binding domain-containing protein [Gammaproteobacteria bacterium]